MQSGYTVLWILLTTKIVEETFDESSLLVRRRTVSLELFVHDFFDLLVRLNVAALFKVFIGKSVSEHSVVE